jgi:hypothetical protein
MMTTTILPAPSCFISRLGKFDLAMWHVELPTGDVVHPMVLEAVAETAGAASHNRVLNDSANSIRFVPIWLGVTRTFIRRARRFDAARLCPLCTEGAEQRGLPNLSDYP